MSDVKSKNLYELLGNDSDQDSDKEPAPPVKVADKPVPRSGKRDASGTAPSEARRGAAGDRGGRGGRRGGSGNDGAFNDREAGTMNNRGKPTDDGFRGDRHSDRTRGGRDQGHYEGRGRGGRASRGGRGRDDRHSRGVPNEHVKQADQSWGAPTGDSEFKDEQAGEEIAKAEEKDEGAAGGWDSSGADGKVWDDGGATVAGADSVAPANGTTPADAPGEPAKEPEPEDTSRSYADYLAEQAEKKLKLGSGVLEPRRANEGTKQHKEWQNAKPMSKEEEQAEYMAGRGEKAKKERQRKEKNKVDVEFSISDSTNARGGSERGRGRGRGDRGDFRGRGRGRGDGYRGRGDRGDGGFRGGRGRGSNVGGSGGGNPNVSDENAFPSLT